MHASYTSEMFAKVLIETHLFLYKNEFPFHVIEWSSVSSPVPATGTFTCQSANLQEQLIMIKEDY